MPTAVWVVLTFVVLGEMAPVFVTGRRASHVHRAGGSTLAGVRSKLALVERIPRASTGASTAPTVPNVGASFASPPDSPLFSTGGGATSPAGQQHCQCRPRMPGSLAMLHDANRDP